MTHIEIRDAILANGWQLKPAGSLASAQMMTSGNTFTLVAFDILIPGE